MKEINKRLLAGVFATMTLVASALTSIAHAEVSASVGASNIYYWRGYDLGGGAAVSGDLSVSGEAGAYAGIWMSSGDGSLGTEYDVYFGWGGEFGDLGVDISYWSYNYPEQQNADGDSIFIGDFAEIVLGLSYGPVAFTYYDNIAPGSDFYGANMDFGSDGYSYFTLGVDIDKFNITYGQHSDVTGSPYDGYAHLDITYNFNDNLSFTMGNVLDPVTFNGVDQNPDETSFVVNLSLPIE